jgi:glucosyl-dolichyl phosphate glucuronosyltransferase
MPEATASVVVCTRNRSAYLACCLRALEAQSLAARHYETIIVDNGSTDDTGAVAASFCRRNGNFRYLREPRPGVAMARNAGVRHSGFDIVAFADDDTEPDSSWLAQIAARFRALPPDVAVVGGEIIPVWGAERPDWLTDRLLRPLSAGLKWSAEPRFLAREQWLIECNSAYRKEILLQVGGFPEHLGRVGDSLLSGEGGVNLLIARAGYRLYYDPSILVRHHIPAARLTRSWFRRRVFWQGITLNLLHRYVEERARQLGLSDSKHGARRWEEIVIPVSATDWCELFDDRSGDFVGQLDRLEGLGYLLQSQSVVVGHKVAGGRKAPPKNAGHGE